LKYITVLVSCLQLFDAFRVEQCGSGLLAGAEDVDPLQVSRGAAPHHVDLSPPELLRAAVRRDGDVTDPVGLAVPGLARERVEEEGLGNGDSGGGVEERCNVVVVGVVEHDLSEEGGLAVAAGAAEWRILVVVEGVVGALDEVAATEDEGAEGGVEGVEKAGPVVVAQKFGPGGLGGHGREKVC